jgi:hypothetical protein
MNNDMTEIIKKLKDLLDTLVAIENNTSGEYISEEVLFARLCHAHEDATTSMLCLALNTYKTLQRLKGQ